VQIIGEASDGIEAVQKANELQAGFDLPRHRYEALNGLEAADQISRLVPAAKILFIRVKGLKGLGQSCNLLYSASSPGINS
jgi:DNA-binding NarL/FixJ family response regulator